MSDDLAAALREAVRALLDDAGEPVVLRAGPRPVLRVPGRGIARGVAASAEAVLQARRVAVAATRLRAAGAPVAAPLTEPAEVGPVVVTVWSDVPDVGPRDEVLYAGLGRALGRLHAVGAGLLAAGAVDLPPWDPAAALERFLRPARAQVEAAWADELRARLAALLPLPSERLTVLHTDAHAGNACRGPGGAVTLVDLEGLAIGPAAYDLAAVEVTERRLGGGAAPFRAALAGYGGLEAADPALRRCCAVRELLAVAFAASAGGAGVEEARRRLDDVRLSRTRRWETLAARATASGR